MGRQKLKGDEVRIQGQTAKTEGCLREVLNPYTVEAP